MSGERLETWEGIISESLGCARSPDWVVRCFKSTPSTMNEARSLLALQGTEKPVLVLAAHQPSGRGRQGRKWLPATEGFFATFACAAPRGLNPAGFSLVVGLMVLECLEEFGCRTVLKWPNDVLSPDGRKLCGILIESIPIGNGRAVLSGIGLNISGEPAEVPGCISLQTLCGRTLAPTALAEKLAGRILNSWTVFLKEGFGPFREDWLKHAFGLGARLRIDTGCEMVEGVFSDVSSGGSIVLICANGRREIASGHTLELPAV